MEIRLIERRDRKAVVELLAEGFANELALSGMGRSHIQSHVGAILTTASRPARLLLDARGWTMQFWVAVDGGEVIGCYGLAGREVLSIASVTVRKDYRGRGVGRKLMEHAFSIARTTRRNRVVLEVLADNAPALRLYHSLGMLEYESRTSYQPTTAIAVPEQQDVCLTAVRREHVGHWHEIFRASVPPPALQFESAYRSDYLGNARWLWLDGRLPHRSTLRKAILLDEQLAGFVVVRRGLGEPFAEVLRPMYLPQVRPHLRTLLALGCEQAMSTRAPRVRLYLSGNAEEARAAATLGLVEERTWLQLYKDLG